MWRTALSRSVREVRFVLKQTPEHHGVWNYVQSSLPLLRELNQNTFFTVTEIDDNFESPSACHIMYTDVNCTEDLIPSDNLSHDQFEKILKQKVVFGIDLPKDVPSVNADREIPISVVEARSTVKHMDDGY